MSMAVRYKHGTGQRLLRTSDRTPLRCSCALGGGMLGEETEKATALNNGVDEPSRFMTDISVEIIFEKAWSTTVHYG